MSMYDIARQVTDEVLGEGTYASINAGHPDPGVQAAIQHANNRPLLPLPNHQFNDGDMLRPVIASVWQNDEPNHNGEVTALLLLLNPEPNFYSVVDIMWSHGKWHLTYETTYPNVVPAVDEYQERGGDY